MVLNIYKLCLVHEEMFKVDKTSSTVHFCVSREQDYKLKMFLPTGLEAEVRFGSVGHSTWTACLGCTQLPRALCHPPEESSPSPHWKKVENEMFKSHLFTHTGSGKWPIYQNAGKKNTFKGKTGSNKYSASYLSWKKTSSSTKPNVSCSLLTTPVKTRCFWGCVCCWWLERGVG